MANTLTSLTVDLYTALDIVARELVGFIPSVSSDMNFTRAAVGQTVRAHVAPAATGGNVTPGVTPPDDGDQTIGNVSVSITKAKRSPIRWNGEQQLALNNNGAPYNKLFADQVAQSMRWLVNQVEADIAALHVNASRAYGTAGTTPFATDLSATANLGKILKDNGAPLSDWNLVMDTSAGAKLRSLATVNKVNEMGGDDLLRRGVLLDLHGFALRESAAVVTSVAGTAASATTNNAGYAVGATTLTLASAGTGTFVAGDVVTFAGDTNQYVLVSGDTDVSNGGTIVLAAPGLKVAMSAATKAITVVAAAARNMAFHRNAIVLATRAPALPEQGDSAVDRMMITDAVSGLSFEVAQYAQYRQMQYEISLAWGCGVTKADNLALLLG